MSEFLANSFLANSSSLVEHLVPGMDMVSLLVKCIAGIILIYQCQDLKHETWHDDIDPMLCLSQMSMQCLKP